MILTVSELILRLIKDSNLGDIVNITQGNSHPNFLVTEVTDNGFFGVTDIRVTDKQSFDDIVTTKAGRELLDLQRFQYETSKLEWLNTGGPKTIEDFIVFVLEKGIPLDTVILNSSEIEYNPETGDIHLD